MVSPCRIDMLKSCSALVDFFDVANATHRRYPSPKGGACETDGLWRSARAMRTLHFGRHHTELSELRGCHVLRGGV